MDNLNEKNNILFSGAFYFNTRDYKAVDVLKRRFLLFGLDVNWENEGSNKITTEESQKLIASYSKYSYNELEQYLYDMFPNSFDRIFSIHRETFEKYVVEYLSSSICLKYIQKYYTESVFNNHDLLRKNCFEMGYLIDKYTEALENTDSIKVTNPSTRYTRFHKSRFENIEKINGYYYLPKLMEEYFAFSVINSINDPIRVNTGIRKKQTLTYSTICNSYKLFTDTVNLFENNKNKSILYYLFERDYSLALLADVSIILVELGLTDINSDEINSLIISLINLKDIPDIGCRQILIKMILDIKEKLISDICSCIIQSYSYNKRELIIDWGIDLSFEDFEKLDAIIGDYWYNKIKMNTPIKTANKNLMKECKKEITLKIIPYWRKIIDDYIKGFSQLIYYAENLVYVLTDESFKHDAHKIASDMIDSNLLIKHPVYSHYPKIIKAKKEAISSLCKNYYTETDFNTVFSQASKYIHHTNSRDFDYLVEKAESDFNSQELMNKLLANLIKTQK